MLLVFCSSSLFLCLKAETNVHGQRPEKIKRRAGERERETRQQANVRLVSSMHLAFVSSTFGCILYYPLADQHLISSSVDSIAAVLKASTCFPEKHNSNYFDS